MTCLEQIFSQLPVNRRHHQLQLTSSTAHLLPPPLLLWVIHKNAAFMPICFQGFTFTSCQFLYISGNLQLSPPAPTSITAAGMWGASPAAPGMFPMPGVMAPGPLPAFPQPSAFGGLPIPPTAWGQQMPPQFAVPPLSPPHLAWGQPASTNPFQTGGDQQGPARPPPRPPAKETPPKVENSAFSALDPLGDREKKSGKDMFKDFQLAKPPAIPARKGEALSNSASAPSGKEAGAFDQYFSSKVGLPQDAADHDDFDINKMPSLTNGKITAALVIKVHVNVYLTHLLIVFCTRLDIPIPAPASAVTPAPSFNPGLLDAAFSSAPNNSASQGQCLNQDIFDKAFGAPDSSPFGAPPVAMVQQASSSVCN